MNNLLTNASKFSPIGSVIRVTTRTDAQEVTISTEDGGVGMTPGQIEHIFDRFYRAEITEGQDAGLGLGLTIVRQIIEDHEGRISVTSKKNVGTTVQFSLPLTAR